MNTATTPPIITPPIIREQRRGRIPDWLWVCSAIVLFYGLLTVGVTSFFRLSRDTAALEKAMVADLPQDTVRMVTVNVGPVTTGTLRTGLSFLHLPREARAGIQTLQAAEVSVYKLAQSSDCFEPQQAFARADAVMKKRHWVRVVGVVADGAFVSVYMPEKVSNPEKLRCCVAVLKDQDLVIAGVRGDLGPILNVIQEQIAREMETRHFAWR